MADTRQIVKWSLVQACPLRRADEWGNRLLNLAEAYGQHADKPNETFGIHEGIYVNATNGVGEDFYIPHSGILIEQEFEFLGGLTGLRTLCGNCPANAAMDELAGCVGYISPPLNWSEFDEHLHRLTEELALKDAIETAFLPTEMMWFRFWMESPLSQAQLQALHPLVVALNEQHDEKNYAQKHRPFAHFLRAIERALYYQLELRVELTPPGHSDFGLHTIFPHCPRCKADAGIGFWTSKKLRHSWQTCEMCGREFDPAETGRREPMHREPRLKLRESMGDDAFQAFAIGYLINQGAGATEAAELTAKYLAPKPPPTPEQLERRELREKFFKRQNDFIRTVLCVGLGTPKPEVDLSDVKLGQLQFTAQEIVIFLARCREHDVKVNIITHHSKLDDELDEVWVHTFMFADAEEAFQDLLNQGCHELFSVSVEIKPLFNEWLRIQKESGQNET